MELHDLNTNELISQKSLSALIWLVNHGRELEFRIDNTVCFISRSNSAKNVSLWVNRSEQSFDSMEALIEKSSINQKPFLQIWDDAEIETLF